MFMVFADYRHCTVNIYNREFNIACLHAAKRRYSTKIKSMKTFLKAFPRKFIPLKYTRYTVTSVKPCPVLYFEVDLLSDNMCLYFEVGLHVHLSTHMYTYVPVSGGVVAEVG